MSREVLLTLLGTLLVINIGVLISIGLLSRRGRARSASVVDSAAGAHGAAPAIPAVSPEGASSEVVARTPDVDVRAARLDTDPVEPDIEAAVASVERVAPVAPVGPPPRVVVATPVVTEPPALALPEAIPAPQMPVAVAVAEQEPDEALIAENGHLRHELEDDSGVQGTIVASIEPARVPMSGNGSPTTAGGKRRRSRRFVLPPLEEDSDRSARAIEAFLGEAHVSPPLAHPERLHRRRHRARRAPGTKATRTSVIVDLVGYQELAVAAGEGQAVRLAGALAEALWRSARVGDEVRELAPGRIQLVLDCDPAGAEAFAERARASVTPWLATSVVPLRIELTTAPGVPASEAG